MGRKRIIAIDKELEDPVVEDYLKFDWSKLAKKIPKSRVGNVSKIAKMAEQIYRESGDEEALLDSGLFDLQSAYDYLRENGVRVSFRALGGRIERGKIPSVKIGRKRYILKDVLDNLIAVKNNFYTVREAYNVYKKHDSKTNYRAFVGRIEKGSIPSVKIDGRRFIPKKAVETYTHLKQTYYTISEAMDEFRKHGIHINRNAFERRLDRGRIPHYKVKGRRYIPKDVFEQVLNIELRRRKH